LDDGTLVSVYAYGGFPDGVKVENGFVTLPALPGIGFEGKADLYAEMKALGA
jgi:L-alanine-DL-glutamate epimerase-like enolase superfamily enzyme